MKPARAVLLILAAAVVPAFAAAPTWDSSGNSQLNGTYYFRQVVYAGSTGGGISAAYAYYGNIVFSGTGTYSISAGATFNSSAQGPQTTTTATTGTYSLSASGFGFISSPLISGANILILVSNHIVIGSETESAYNDMFVAAPYSASLSAASFQGTYTISSFFPSGSPANSLDATYQLSPNGALNLGNVNISGYSGAGSIVSQSSSGVKYAFSNGAYSITFPTNSSAHFYQGGSITNTSGENGPVFLYMSPDSNFVFGGSTLGFDMFVGVKNVASGTSTPLSGLYYEVGFDDSEAQGLDSYYGSFNTFSGNVIGHRRLLFAGSSPEGYTYYDSYPTSFSGAYTDTSYPVNYTVGPDGIRVGIGTGGALGIEVALPYTSPSPSGSVYIDPTGIVNSGSSAPYTAGISPGEFITIYKGVNLENSTVFTPTATFPTTLGGVKVLVDGIAAPLYYVISGQSPQISFVVPYEICPASPCTYPIASIQVDNNGAFSNIVTTYVNQTTPGVFTNPPGGISVGDVVDYPASNPSAYFIVNESHPAQPGDTVALYLSGLGTPFPANPDGALGGVSCVVGTCLLNDITIDVNGVSVGAVAFAGLAPGEVPGLYQVNFTVPTGPFCPQSPGIACINVGDNTLGISGPDSYSDESVIPVGSGTTAAAVSAPAQPTSAVRGKILPRLSGTASR